VRPPPPVSVDPQTANRAAELAIVKFYGVYSEKASLKTWLPMANYFCG
jgi:hypothetical protein